MVAWLLVLAIMGLSVFFVWAYAMQFGAQKTSRWLTSLLVTFLASVLVIEPVMVGLLLVVGWLVWGLVGLLCDEKGKKKEVMESINAEEERERKERSVGIDKC